MFVCFCWWFPHVKPIYMMARSVGGKGSLIFTPFSWLCLSNRNPYPTNTHKPGYRTHTQHQCHQQMGGWAASLILLQKDQIIIHVNWSLKTLISKMPHLVSRNSCTHLTHTMNETTQRLWPEDQFLFTSGAWEDFVCALYFIAIETVMFHALKGH